jgi:outer membrane protein assembly factor BamB
MNWRKATATAVLALVVIFCMTGCPLKPPATPGAPWGADSTWTGVSYACSVSTTVSKGSIRYSMDWVDKIDTADEEKASGETLMVTHVWTDTGAHNIRVKAMCASDLAKASEWSPTKAVRVILNHAPVVDNVNAPPVAVRNVEAFFTVRGHDEDNDSIRVLVDWGNSKTDTGYFLSPCSVEVSHVFTQIDTGAMVIVEIQDWKGTKSLPDTVWVPVGTAGGVIWWWQSDDPENGGEGFTTSPVIATVGTEERLFSGDEGDYRFYSIRDSDGGGEKKTVTRWPEYSFTGHPGLCAATNHIIVGSEEGELYALKLGSMGWAWQWPNMPREESLTGIEWGAPAFNGNKVYIGHMDDSLFLFQDAGSQGNRIAAYGCNASVVDAPVIDGQGNVYFGTDSGYLCKVGPELDTVFWRAHLQANGEIHSPIVGSDGTIYCASDSFRAYALDPNDGSIKSGWPVTLVGEAFRPALGQSALFVGTSFGKAYSINPATGGINWERSLSSTGGFSTTPIAAANGYVYFQDDDDVLFCLNQVDGTVIWACDCSRYLPRAGGGNSHRPRRMQLTDYPPNPTITAGGNILVAGYDALYCVAGYPEGPLDPLAPWPKWQHDLYNTGHVGGGR